MAQRIAIRGFYDFTRYSIDFTNKRLATGWFDNFSIWDIQTGELLWRESKRLDNRLRTAVFSPDGSKLAFGTLYDTRIYDVETRCLLSVLPFKGKILRFSPDGQNLLLLGEDILVILNIFDVGNAYIFPYRSMAFGASFSADGRYLSFVLSHVLVVFEYDEKLRDMRKISDVPCFVLSESHVSYSHSGRYVAIYRYMHGVIDVYDVYNVNAGAVATFNALAADVLDAGKFEPAFTWDEKGLIAPAADKRLALYDLSSGIKDVLVAADCPMRAMFYCDPYEILFSRIDNGYFDVYKDQLNFGHASSR